MIASLRGNDVILSQITSRARADEYSVALEDADFLSGGLRQSSTIRPNRLFTADSAMIAYTAGLISDAKLNEVVDGIIRILAPR